MNKLLIALAVLISTNAFGQVKRDTIYVDRPDMVVKVLVPTKIVVDKKLTTVMDSAAMWRMIEPFPKLISSHIYNKHRWYEYQKNYFRKIKLKL